jgi:hypothetical protein
MRTSRRIDSKFLPGLPLAKEVTPREVKDRVCIFASTSRTLRLLDEFVLRCPETVRLPYNLLQEGRNTLSISMVTYLRVVKVVK